MKKLISFVSVILLNLVFYISWRIPEDEWYTLPTYLISVLGVGLSVMYALGEIYKLLNCEHE